MTPGIPLSPAQTQNGLAIGTTLDKLALARKVCEHPPGDFTALVAVLSEDAVFRITAPKGTPLSGEFRGKEAITNYFINTNNRVASDVVLDGPLQYFTSCDAPNRVVVIAKEHWTIAKNGQRVSLDLAIVLDFDDGELTNLLMIQDLSEVARAYN